MKPLKNLSIRELRRDHLIEGNSAEQEQILQELKRRGVTEPSKEFLNILIPSYRSAVRKWFNSVAKEHKLITEPEKFLKLLRKERRIKLKEYEKKSKKKLKNTTEEFLKLLTSHREKALKMASWIISYEILTEKEKEEEEEQKKRDKKYKRKRPPSPKQVAYLIALGHTEQVHSSQQASEIINEFKKKQAERGASAKSIPTEKQLLSLKGLGYKGEVNTKHQASLLIDQLKNNYT